MKLSKRQIMLLDLLRNQKDYCTVKMISLQLGVSERTVHNELDRIKPFLAQENKKFKKKRGVGIKIVDIPTDKDKKTFHFNTSRLTVMERRMDILYQLLFEEKVVTQQALSDSYFVSKSSIQNDLNFIHQHFIPLTSDHDGTYIRADEKVWQAAHLKFNQYVMSLDKEVADRENVLINYYPAHIVNVCNRYLSEYISENKLIISDLYLQNILSILIILMYRIQKGFHHKNNQESYQTSYATEKILNGVSKIAKELDLSLNEQDINFLLSQLFSNRLNVSIATDFDYDRLTERLIREMEVLMGIPFSSDEKLRKQLLLHIPAMFSRMQNDSGVKNPFTLEIKNEISLTYNTLLLAIKNIEEEFNINLTEDEMAFLAIYFQIAQERIQPIKRILIVCPMGIAASELLVNRLRRIVSPKDILQSASVAEINQLDLTHFNLILSTVDLNDIHYKWVKISLFINETDIHSLLNVRNQEADLSLINNTSSKLNLTKDYFYMEIMDAQNKKTLLTNLCQELVENNYVSPDFLDSVLKREELSSTDLPTGVATPHGASEYVHRTCITIVKNKRKIQWRNYYVDIIFLIAIAKKDTGRTKQIISEIYQMISDNEKLNLLRSEN